MTVITEVQLQNGQVYELPSGGGGGTYTLSKSGNTIILTGSGGDVSSVTDSDTTYPAMTQAQGVAGTNTTNMVLSPKVLHDTIEALDDNTTYSISISGHTITLTPSSGSAQSITVPDNNTTYTLSRSGHTLTLTPSSGSAQSVTIPDNNTTYSLSLSGHTLKLTPSSGSAQTVNLPDNNTTYSLSLSGHTLTLTPSSGSAQSVTIPDNNTWRGYTLRESITVFDNLTISPQTYAQAYSSLPSITGYEPVALGGYNISLASSGGQNATYCYAFAMVISYSSNELFWQIRNTHSTAVAKIRLYANILYLQK